MNFDNLKKLATGTILFNLHRIISPRLVTIVYLLGLAAIVLWAINHFFLTFSFGFGSGLWGLLEIAVFGLLAMLVLRIACEAVIVWFKAHAAEAAQATKPLASASLIDDVRGAIEELADEEPEAEDAPIVTPPPSSAPSPTPPPAKQNTPTPPPPENPQTPAAPKTASKPANAKAPTKTAAKKAPAKAATPRKRTRTTKARSSGASGSGGASDQT